MRWNQNLYRRLALRLALVMLFARFDVLAYGGEGIKPLLRRCGSCPPNQSSRNPITGDSQEICAGPHKTEHEQRAKFRSGQGVKLLTNHADLDAQAANAF